MCANTFSFWEVTQSYSPAYYHVPANKVGKIENETCAILLLGILDCVSSFQDQFVSNILTRDKAGGSLRLILDLLDFIDHVTHTHFKMYSLI